MEYKNTIITPKTDFPMKAGLPMREPGMLERREQMDLYEALLEKNKDLPPFVLHDGPPFSNGYIHMGHALNKTLKDFIIRSHAMMGYYTPYVPGWDNHGLPIERAIETSKKKLNKDMTVPEFRTACEAFAEAKSMYRKYRDSVCACSKSLQSCPPLCEPMDYGLPGSRDSGTC